MNPKWLQHYDPGVPATIGDYPAKTLVDFVREHARTDKVGAIFKGRAFTFRDLDTWSSKLAGALQAEGIGKGDRVGLVLPNAPQFLICELAAWKLGALIAPQNPIYTARELRESFAASEPKLVITLTPFYEKVKEAFGGRVIATNIKEYLPPLLRVLFTLLKEKKEGHRITLRAGDAWLQDLLASPAAPVEGTPGLHDDAVVLMSGGTTGTPAPVVSDHHALVIAGTQIGAWLAEALEGEDSSIMLPLPLFHTYGCTGAQSVNITRGIPLILVPNPRDLDDIVKSIQRDRPALFCGVPTLFNALLNHPAVIARKVDFRSIRACFSGAAALMAETKKRFEELTGGRIVEGYSLTEAAMACCVNPLRGTNKIGSVGLPISDVHAKIVDSETGSSELAPGEVGEILLRAPQIRQDWLSTGDLGYIDADGFVFIVDRKKDLIKTSGFQVWPREIEEVIAAHPAVMEVGVAGLPDERRGEIVAAWIVPRAGETLDLEELRAWCRERLAPYKVPSRIEVRKELPKTMIGKVLRRILVAEA